MISPAMRSSLRGSGSQQRVSLHLWLILWRTHLNLFWTQIQTLGFVAYNCPRDSKMRLTISEEEALCLLWSLEEAILISEPEEEELISSLISRLSPAVPSLSSASELRAYKLQRPFLPGESLPLLPVCSRSLTLPLEL